VNIFQQAAVKIGLAHRFAVSQVGLILSDESALEHLEGLLNSINAEDEGGMDRANLALADLSLYLLGSQESWVSGNIVSREFFSWPRAEEFMNQEYTNNSAKHTQVTSRGPAGVPSPFVAILITVAYEGEADDIELPMVGPQDMQFALSCLIDGGRDGMFSSIALTYCPEKTGDSLTEDQLLINFPTFIRF
jgi:uncharacterized membrane protein